jgi:hypothetical protein
MKRIKGIFVLLVVLFFFVGCTKIEQPEEFQVSGVRILQASESSDGTYLLLQPFYQYSNPAEVVIVDEDWIIDGVPVSVSDYKSLLPDTTKAIGDVITTWDKISLLWKVPRGTKEVRVGGTFKANYPYGPIASQLQEVILPIAL